MFGINSRILYSITLFVLLMLLVYLTKPAPIYHKDETIKAFGINKNETIISLGVFTILAAVMSMYIFAIIDMIFS